MVHELNECVSSRLLKLEKENQELQTSIERLKEENHLLQEQQLHTQELDRENQGLSKKVGGPNVLKHRLQIVQVQKDSNIYIAFHVLVLITAVCFSCLFVCLFS